MNRKLIILKEYRMFDIKYLTDEELKETMVIVEYWMNYYGIEYDYKELKKITKKFIEYCMKYIEIYEEQLNMWSLRNYLRKTYI